MRSSTFSGQHGRRSLPMDSLLYPSIRACHPQAAGPFPGVDILVKHRLTYEHKFYMMPQRSH